MEACRCLAEPKHSGEILIEEATGNEDDQLLRQCEQFHHDEKKPRVVHVHTITNSLFF